MSVLAWTRVEAAVVLQYHHVDTKTPNATSVTPQTFAMHMSYLADSGFTVLALPDLLEALHKGIDIPAKAVAITFDDGYRSILTNARPILNKYQFPYTIFINPELAGTGSDFLSWQDLELLQREGATIANHTVSHPHLIRKLDGESDHAWKVRVREEILGAENLIQSRLGISPGLLAYPYGEYNQAVESIVAELGLTAFAQHSGAFNENSNWQALPRFPFGGAYGEDIQDFADKVNSLAMPIKSATAIDQNGNSLVDPLLPNDVRRPTLQLELTDAALASRVSCFASGQGVLQISAEGNRIQTQPKADLPVGRSRINCTASSGQSGRYHWYSHLFIRKNSDNSWYPEY